MDSKALSKIFSQGFDDAKWIEVLQSVFGAKNGLLAQPKNITDNLKGTHRDRAEAAYELGSFTTSDDRIIGLYKIDVNPDVWLERNKVGLRELLRNVYKYDVDGAIIVFVQDKKWRLSFVSEIKMLNDEGEVIEHSTEPKRYTYLLGENEKVRTPSDRLAQLSGKTLSIQDILNAFSVEALNEEFYKIIQAFFYELVGGKVGKGNKVADFGTGTLKLPSVPKENRQVYQEFAVRLIGRSVFCWFLKMKRSATSDPLLPESLLASKSVKSNSNYYHTILERIFFQTLNTPMDQRVDNLPEGCEKIPFLNGGLFEPGIDDFYKPNNTTGKSEHIHTLSIPDNWFLKFFEELEKYNFTIDENSVTDVEVSVDPEMLGRIFENLLAEIDPDSGETARKATGSFYTPREIVDYMATESLVQYLHNKTAIDHDLLRPIFKMLDKGDPQFSPAETEEILDALDKVKILDPACGSGAFPMGVLQKIVQALQKLDKEAEWWIERQVKVNTHPTARKAVREKLAGNPEYARKIGVIQNSLYGVDIQPVAAEISKLRCFLSLVVDEHIDDSKPNRGIEPLPNLEFKFVTADTLVGLPETTQQRGLFDHYEDLQELEQLRTEYIQSYGAKKIRIKDRFLKVQQSIFKDQLNLFIDPKSRAYHLSKWNPFGHEKSDWFDPKWMFGVENFQIVIGNPPYVRIQNLKKDLKKYYGERYSTATKNYDIYVLFDQRGMELLSDDGNLIYIQPNKFLNADYGVGLRTILSKQQWVRKITDFQASQVFSSATTYTCILHCVKENPEDHFEYVSFSGSNKSKAFIQYSSTGSLSGVNTGKFKYSKYSSESWSFGTPNQIRIFSLVEESGKPLSIFTQKIFQGLVTSADPVYILEKKEDRYYSKFLETEVQLENELIKPLLKGAEIRRYRVDFQNLYLIFPYELKGDRVQLIPQESFKLKYPLTWRYLKVCEEKLRGREKGKMDHENWYAYVYPKNLDQFEQPKIMTQVLANRASMVFDEKEGYHFVGGGNAGGYGVVLKKDSGISYWYLLALLNSRLLDYYLQNHSSRFQNDYFSYAKRFLEKLPIVEANNEVQILIGNLARCIQFMAINPDMLSESHNVKYSHILQLFEDIVDACIYEVYLEEHMLSLELNVISIVRNILPVRVYSNEAELAKAYSDCFMDLRSSRANNRIKQMTTKSPDLLRLMIQNSQ